MTIDVSKLQEELDTAGILNNGCDSSGVVYDKNNNHIEGRADVANIVALHITNTAIREAADAQAVIDFRASRADLKQQADAAITRLRGYQTATPPFTQAGYTALINAVKDMAAIEEKLLKVLRRII